ncbi:hypothetical protein D3C86_1431500 [compost metagenome]
MTPASGVAVTAVSLLSTVGDTPSPTTIWPRLTMRLALSASKALPALVWMLMTPVVSLTAVPPL